MTAMTTQTTTTFVGVVGRDENLFRETKSGGSAGGNQAILESWTQLGWGGIQPYWL